MRQDSDLRYLAGLRCDGSEREPAEEDPMEFVICNESSNTVSIEQYPPREEQKVSIDRVCSVTSQDTDADVNIDLELVSKEDPQSPTDVTSQLTESSKEPKGTIDDEQGSSASNQTLKAENSSEASKTDSVCDKRTNGDEASSTTENGLKKSGISNNSFSEEPSKCRRAPSPGNVSSEERRSARLGQTDLTKFYPNIPGIGPRLSAEEVASVAIWLSECARLQEGMVGPRNLRHINCPPLDKQELSES